MKSFFQLLIIATIVNLFHSRSVIAQSEEELTLDLSRDFGYSSGTGRIQGTFSMRVSGPDDLTRVEFLIDDKVIGEIDEPPFRFQFHTDTYPEGIHTISAIGFTTDGRTLASNERRVEFVGSQEGPQEVLKIILPIVALVLVVSVITIIIPTITGKGKRSAVPLGSPRSYGISGGAICPKCKRPFSIHFFGLNLLVGKLDRCPHCGHWSIVRAASPQELSMAELAEFEQIPQGDQELQLSEEDRQKKELEESKYQDI